MTKKHSVLSTHSHLIPLALALGLVVGLPMPFDVNAGWLNSYSTPENTISGGFSGFLFDDGYLILGKMGQHRLPSNWFAKINNKGDVIWAKKTVANMFFAPIKESSNTFSFLIPNDPSMFTWGKAKIDLNTFAISVVSAKTFKSEISSYFSYQELDQYAFGYVAGSGTNSRDAAIVKFDTNDNILWSHVYDYKQTDSNTFLEKLDNGYLISWSYQDSKTDTGTVLAKLDTNGNIVGSAVVLPESNMAKKLPSGGYLVTGTKSTLVAGESMPFIVKLDSDLKYLWGKYIDRGSYSSEYYTLIFSRELSDGTLVFYGLHSRNDFSNKGNLNLQLSKDGALISAKEVQLDGGTDFYIDDFLAARNSFSNGTSQGFGNKTGPTGVIASFNEHYGAQWIRTLSGIKVTLLEPSLTGSGYLVSGLTGIEQSNFVAGTLDSNGNISGCGQIGAFDGQVTTITPAFNLLDLDTTVAPINITDKGPVNATIENAQFTISTEDMPLTKTQICNDGKDIGTGGGNNTGGNGGGTTTGKPVVSQTESADPVQVGQPFSYTVNFSNNAAFEATSVKLTDKLPSKVKLVSTPVPSQGTCKGKATVVCKFGAVASGASVNVAFTVTRSKSGKVKNSAVFTYKMVKKAGDKKKKSYTTKPSTEKTTVTK